MRASGEQLRSAATAQLRVHGGATAYRLHDVGYAVSLERAARLLGESIRGRARPGRTEAQAIRIRNPPLFVELGPRPVTLSGATFTGTLSAHLFDFGVCSLHFRVPAPAGTPWNEFSDFGAQVDRSREISAIFDRALDELVAKLRPAIERPQVAPLAEDYIVFRVDALEDASGVPAGVDQITDEHLVPLLLGEQRPLAPGARRDLLPHRFSYYGDDLAVLTWDNALVVEPRADDRDVEYVLEFANAQLLELRLYDSQLDADLPALYDRVTAVRGRGWPRLSVRFRTVLAELQTRVADITEIVERVENALKVTDDVYLARIYAAALEIFRERAWRSGINSKLGILRDTYAMIHGEAQAARAELLELAIVLLIVFDIVLGLLKIA